MTSLGDLGVKRVVFKKTFGWFGEELTVNPSFSPLDLIDFMQAAGSVDENDPSAITVVKDLFKTIVSPDEFATFWRLAKENGQSVEDLMGVYQKVAASVADRPFGPPSESSDGATATVTALPAASSSSGSDLSARVIQRLEANHRPDLANVVDIARAVHTV